jgi:hypothetical protein
MRGCEEIEFAIQHEIAESKGARVILLTKM